jgi:DNA (cytosine-5)-methyltransferase 1
MMGKIDNIAVVDLFCGIGGLSNGFVTEGFNVVAGYDNDKSCKFAFEENNNSTFVLKNIEDVRGEEINEAFGDKFKILVGCAPCQPFSSYSFKHKGKTEDKWGLLYSFGRLIEEVKPTIVSMENVPQLLHFKKAPVFKDFYEKLTSLGYFVSFQEVFCPDYGIPQRRRRLVLLASLLGNISLIEKTHQPKNYITVKDVISSLPKVAAGETDKTDSLHRARSLTPLNLERIRATTEGGSWKNWPLELQLNCHKRKSGRSYGSVYGRMKWNEPAPTMTTHCTGLGNGRFGHPDQDRAITLREASLFQTFPSSYLFFENENTFNPSIVCRHIGNAVPPLLGKVIAKSIATHLKEYKII